MFRRKSLQLDPKALRSATQLKGDRRRGSLNVPSGPLLTVPSFSVEPSAPSAPPSPLLLVGGAEGGHRAHFLSVERRGSKQRRASKSSERRHSRGDASDRSPTALFRRSSLVAR